MVRAHAGTGWLASTRGAMRPAVTRWRPDLRAELGIAIPTSTAGGAVGSGLYRWRMPGHAGLYPKARNRFTVPASHLSNLRRLRPG